MASKNERYIEVGSLGGFAGKYEECKIMPDGLVYKRKGYNDEYVRQMNISSTQANQFFNIIKEFKTQNLKINDPSNLSYFIRLTEKSEKKLELIWGGEEPMNTKIDMLYRIMTGMCKDQEITR